jgi:hypothetical protein
MSGKRQHYLPQFLVKGFSSRSAHSNHFVWVYRKGKVPFESNIINVGVEKDFYSEDDSTVDEKITDAEIGYAELINELRTFKKTVKINEKMLPDFIAHLEIRTRNVRESLLEMSDLFLNEIIKFFQEPENVNKFVAKYTGDAMLQVDIAIHKKLKKISIPKAKRAAVDSIIKEQKKLAQSNLRPLFIFFINRKLPDLINTMPDTVKKGHLKALQDSVSPKLRVEEHQKLIWNLVYFENEYLILGDSGVLFEVESLKKYSTFWEQGQKIINVFLPISKNHLVIGSNSEICDVPDLTWLNREIAEYSREYFLSAINNPFQLNLANNIGNKSQWFTENEIMSISNELFRNDLQKGG